MSWWKCILIGSLVGSASVWAVKAAPFLINSTQPDGSVVQIRKVGNEHFNYTLTGEDSVLVVRDSAGYWNYADEHGKKTGMRVHAKSKRGAEKLPQKTRFSRNLEKVPRKTPEKTPGTAGGLLFRTHDAPVFCGRSPDG